MSQKDNFYLFGFSEDELTEIYESLVLKDEMTRRLSMQQEETDPGESKLLQKISQQFSKRYSTKLQQEILDTFDDYLNHEIDDEILWQKIEDQLRSGVNREEK